MVNVILLLVNFVALLWALIARSMASGDAMAWLKALPWDRFGSEFWAITQAASVDSLSVLLVWFLASLVWLTTTVWGGVMARKSPKNQGAVLSDLQAEPSLSASSTSPAAEAPSIPTAAAASAVAAGKSTGASDAALGPLLNDLEAQVSQLSPEAQRELDQLKRALDALVSKP